METDKNVKTNLPDVLALYIKALVLNTGERQVRLPKDVIRRAQFADLRMSVGLDGNTVFELIEGADPDATKIIIPTGHSPLTILD